MIKKHPKLKRLSRLRSDDSEFISRTNRSLAKWKDMMDSSAVTKRKAPKA